MSGDRQPGDTLPGANDLRSFALDLLSDAGQTALRWFRNGPAVENKLAGTGGFDPVTEADRAVESLIRERLGAQFPDHGIIGEEHGTFEGSSRYTWIIDPIDGTRAFMTGMTGWGILLGLLEDGEPLWGFANQPYLGETFVGSPDGAFLHKRETTPLAVRSDASLDDAVLYCTHPDMWKDDGQLERWQRLARRTRLMRYGGDCYAYCMLAHGLVDLVVENGLQPYDILPLVPVIEGAGGVVTDIRGEAPLRGGLVVAAANAELHEQAMKAMGG